MKIKDIIKHIDNRELFVPAFQREYVWRRANIEGLFRSLINAYPTGTLLTWQTDDPPELKGDKYSPDQGLIKLLLDGQQRVSTLYMLMTNKYPPYYDEQDVKTDVWGLNVNVETKEVEYYRATKMKSDPAWVDITSIFMDEVCIEEVKRNIAETRESHPLTEDVSNAVDDCFHTVKEICNRDYEELTVPRIAPIEKVIDIFHVVNSSGVSLSDSELAMAQICGYWPEARNEFKNKIEDLKKNGWWLTVDFLVHVLLAVLYNKGSKLKRLHARDNKERVKAAWDSLSGRVLDEVRAFLRDEAFVDHTDELHTPYVLIPIISYWYKQGGAKVSDKQKRKIIKWFYCAQLRFNYMSMPLVKLDKELKIIDEHENSFDILLRNVRNDRGLGIAPEEFKRQSVRHPLYSLMIWYFKSVNAVCPVTGNPLRHKMGVEHTLYREKIFTSASLVEKDVLDLNRKYGYTLAHELTNCIVQTVSDNKSKALHDARVYLLDVAKNQPLALTLQCVPEELSVWNVEKYLRFLEKRREMLAEALNVFIDSFSDDDYVSFPDFDYEELIAVGEDENTEFKSSMIVDPRTGQREKKTEFKIVKSVAAFANNQGGKLLIGVDDNGMAVGIENDYGELARKNRDGFKQHLTNLISSRISRGFCASKVKSTFVEIDDKDVCVVEVMPADKEIFIKPPDSKHDTTRFYARVGNTSQEFTTEEALEYIKNRFDRKS